MYAGVLGLSGRVGTSGCKDRGCWVIQVCCGCCACGGLLGCLLRVVLEKDKNCSGVERFRCAVLSVAMLCSVGRDDVVL